MCRPLRPLTLLLCALASPALAATDDAGPPFGQLELVDEVNAGDPADPHPFHENPSGASKLVELLGRKARALPMQDSAQVMAWKLGAGKGLVAGRAYLLVVEYPEDTGRQMVIINRGADETRTLATGQTIGDAREGYTYPAPESLKYPLTGRWERHRTLFFLHERFQGLTSGRDESNRTYVDDPAKGFWVIVGHFRRKDSPLDARDAVGGGLQLFALGLGMGT
ncbi:MAG: hypothetical protein ACK4N5_16335, partial [Myxococcales bacterium]